MDGMGGAGTVSLSDEEQGRLREIEALTAAADPRFAAQLDLDLAAQRRRHLRATCWCPLGVAPPWPWSAPPPPKA